MSNMMTEAELKTMPIPTLVESATGTVYRLTVRARGYVTLERVTPIPDYLPPNAHRPAAVERITFKQACRVLITSIEGLRKRL